MNGPIQNEIQTRLTSYFAPVHLEIINESDNHSGPPGRESHFKVVIVAKKFLELSQPGSARLARQREIYKVLEDLIREKIHALALYTYTPDEWAKKQKAPESPLCANAPKKQS